MIALSLFASLGLAAQEFDAGRIVIGNWTGQVAAVSQSAPDFSLPSFYARINVTTDKIYSVNIYETNESDNILQTINLSIDKHNFTVLDSEGSSNPEEIKSLLPRIGDHRSVSGQWSNYLYNFVLSSATKAHLSLIDSTRNVFLVINLVKDIDRTPQPWYRELLPQGLMMVLLLLVQGYSFWSEKRAMKNQVAKTAGEVRPAVDDCAGETESPGEETNDGGEGETNNDRDKEAYNGGDGQKDDVVEGETDGMRNSDGQRSESTETEG
jgi:hypothetical protein